jgi:photosystem II stability/assembly factor-like uncharacterized protein
MAVLAFAVSACGTQATATRPLDGQVVALRMVGSHDGWAWAHSLVARTSDGAASFVDVTPASLKRSSVTPVASFLDSRHAWVLAGSPRSSLLLRTDDGGSTWTRLAGPPRLEGWTVDSVTFVDPEHGWLTAQRGQDGYKANEVKLLRTVDRGTTWAHVNDVVQRINIEPNVQRGDCGWLDSITWASSRSGYAGVSCPFDAPLSIQVTSDGGRTWRRIQLPSLPPRPGNGLWGGVSPVRVFGNRVVALASRCVGADSLSCRVNGAIYTSSDQGRTWSIGELFLMGGGEVTASGPDHMWIPYATLNQNAPASLLGTSNGGGSWSSITLPSRLEPNLHGSRTFQFVTPHLGFAVASQEFVHGVRFYRTVDGGRTFTEFFPRLHTNLPRAQER